MPVSIYDAILVKIVSVALLTAIGILVAVVRAQIGA
jgi:hypothetical protein